MGEEAMKQLYPHQLDLVAKSRMTGTKAVLLQAPTGIGKSVIATHIVHSAMSKGGTSWFIVPRRELLRQMSQQYCDAGIEHTFIAQGEQYYPTIGNAICSLGTLVRRLDKLVLPKLAVIDETHYGAAALDTVIRWLRSHGTFILGLSATPWKSSGQGLGCWYDAMVEGPSIKWLIQEGYLSQYRLFAPDRLDLSGIRKVAGDYNKSDLAEKMEGDRVLVGNVVKHYTKHAMGKRGVTFTVSRKHSEIVCAAYNANGVPAACIDGETPEDERKRLARALATGELLQLVNVDLLTFGYDLASAAGMEVSIECMSDLRPTKSLALQMQKWGRVLRKKPEPALIFDHANNVYEHGYPDDERQWTLKDRDRKEGGDRAEQEVKARTCPQCWYTSRPTQVCPNCGFVHPVESREIEEVDGELVELQRGPPKARNHQEALILAEKLGLKNYDDWAMTVTHDDEWRYRAYVNAASAIQDAGSGHLAAVKKEKRMEVGRAKTLAEIRTIAKERGYSSGWIWHQARLKGINA
jgi:DNA repair protein RadD